nr:uncharacterized protein LOC128692575 [Cherax quadricarinatus]XP_053637713.1 uncharacterized protein LOC128692575 [Cherax quadricarinatus]XP_053637714.1 uncharacterized protein LOC128692575 [Cherax quadricarinatus]
MTKSRTELKYSYPKRERETVKCNTSTFKAKTNIKRDNDDLRKTERVKARDRVTTALDVPVKPVSSKTNTSERSSDKRDPSVTACRNANSSYGDPAKRAAEPRNAEKLQTPRSNLITVHCVPLSERANHQLADTSHHSDAGRYHPYPHGAGRYHRYPHGAGRYHVHPHDAGRYHLHPHDAGRYHLHPHTSIRYHSNEFPHARFTNFRQHPYTSHYQRLDSRQRDYFHYSKPGFHSRHLPNTNIHISTTQGHNTSYEKDNVNKTQKKDDSRKSFEHIRNGGVIERNFKSNLSWHTPVNKTEMTREEKLTKSEKDAKVDKIRIKLQNVEKSKKENNRERERAVKCGSSREKSRYKQSEENVINRGQVNLGKCETKVSSSSDVHHFTPSSRSLYVSDTKNANVKTSHKSDKIREKLKKRKTDQLKVLGRHMVTCSYVMEDKVVDTCPLGHILDPVFTSFNITTGRLTAFCTSCNIKIYMNQTWTPEL